MLLIVVKEEIGQKLIKKGEKWQDKGDSKKRVKELHEMEEMIK